MTPQPLPIAFNHDILIRELRRDEGCKHYPYQDTLGLWSVGVGRNLERKGPNGEATGLSPLEEETLGFTLQSVLDKCHSGHASDCFFTDNDINLLLTSDINEIIGALDHSLPWWRNLDPIRQRAMVNLGMMGCTNPHHGLLTMHTFLNLMATGDYVTAATDLLNTQYARQVGQRANRLARMIRTGVEQGA